MSSLSTIITETYWNTRENQMNAQSAIEQSDTNPHTFSTDEEASQAETEASSLHFWKTLITGVRQQVWSVMKKHYKNETDAIEQKIDEENTSPLDEIRLRFKTEATHMQRTRAIFLAIMELSWSDSHRESLSVES